MNAAHHLNFLAADHRLEGIAGLQAALAGLAAHAYRPANAFNPTPFFKDAENAARCAVEAGATLDAHVGLRLDGYPVPPSLVGCFLSACYGTNPGTSREGELILVAARCVAIVEMCADALEELEAILESAERFADDGLINSARRANLQISDVLRRLQAKKNPPLAQGGF